MSKTPKRGATKEDPMEAAKRIMRRLVETPVEPHKDMVARRQAEKPEPKRRRAKK